jgi:acyl carrier protein
LTKIENKIIEAITGILNSQGRTATINVESPLFSSQVLDSVAGVELVLFLENEFALNFFKSNIGLADMDSVAKIQDLIIKYAPRREPL